jgi:predicted phosphate transport protein (TIGR00153 family)
MDKSIKIESNHYEKVKSIEICLNRLTFAPVGKLSMHLNSLFQALVPKNEKCFGWFEKGTKNIVLASECLNQLIGGDGSKRMILFERMKNLELKGDEITDAIKNEVSTVFVLPFDREEVYQLAILIDDVVDDIHGISKRVDLYKIHQFPSVFSEMSSIIHLTAIELLELVQDFKKLRYNEAAREHIQTIREYERQMDHLQESAIANLFETGSDPIEIIKIQEVFTIMAKAQKHAGEAASLIEAVLVKFN